MNYSLSAGYLLFPETYKNYRQTNVNLYLEFLGAMSLDQKDYYIDASPEFNLYSTAFRVLILLTAHS